MKYNTKLLTSAGALREPIYGGGSVDIFPRLLIFREGKIEVYTVDFMTDDFNQTLECIIDTTVKYSQMYQLGYGASVTVNGDNTVSFRMSTGEYRRVKPDDLIGQRFYVASRIGLERR